MREAKEFTQEISKGKIQTEKSQFEIEGRDQIGRSCTSVITMIIFIQLVFMGSSYSTGIGITINRRKMVKLEIVQLPK